MKIFIITEGNAKIGYGHLTRCLSISQGFKARGFSTTFIIYCDESGKRVLGGMRPIAFDWIEETDNLIELIQGADVAIIDSYLADITVYERISRSVKRAVFLDDNLRISYPPGIIINGAVNAEKLPYSPDDDHTYLLGLEYTPMRAAFWKIPVRIPGKDLENILITIGGGDFEGLTFQILRAIREKFPQLNYHVVLGFGTTTEKDCDQNGKVNFYRSLNAYEMCELMVSCDLAISAAGQTSYELVQSGTPSIFIQVADNQKNNIEGWLDKGIIKKIICSDSPDYIAHIIDSMTSLVKPEIKMTKENNSTLNIVDGILDSHV